MSTAPLPTAIELVARRDPGRRGLGWTDRCSVGRRSRCGLGVLWPGIAVRWPSGCSTSALVLHGSDQGTACASGAEGRQTRGLVGERQDPAFAEGARSSEPRWVCEAKPLVLSQQGEMQWASAI